MAQESYDRDRDALVGLLKTDPPGSWLSWSKDSLADELGLSINRVNEIVKKDGIDLPPLRKRLDGFWETPPGRELMSELRVWAGGQGPDKLTCWRAAIVLDILETKNCSVAESYGISAGHARRMVNRLSREGLDGLRPKILPRIDLKSQCDEKMRQLIDSPPPSGASSWTQSSVAATLGFTYKRVSIFFAEHGLSPRSSAYCLQDLSDESVAELRRWAEGAAPDSLSLVRSKAVLEVLDGEKQVAVASRHGVSFTALNGWMRDFMKFGVAGLHKSSKQMKAVALASLWSASSMDTAKMPPQAAAAAPAKPAKTSTRTAAKGPAKAAKTPQRAAAASPAKAAKTPPRAAAKGPAKPAKTPLRKGKE
ncbi:MAG: hypothetical protein LBT40_17225 [Deltaproteobacteria bacterium]|nr:hypothetical protein [Deltaproteobacteria bacterium]